MADAELPRRPFAALARSYATGYVSHALDAAAHAIADALVSADTHLEDRQARAALAELRREDRR